MMARQPKSVTENRAVERLIFNRVNCTDVSLFSGCGHIEMVILSVILHSQYREQFFITEPYEFYQMDGGLDNAAVGVIIALTAQSVTSHFPR